MEDKEVTIILPIIVHCNNFLYIFFYICMLVYAYVICCTQLVRGIFGHFSCNYLQLTDNGPGGQKHIGGLITDN